jgi:hypothetical protein
MPNSTHYKSVARAYARACGLPYARALAAVTAAADAGALPHIRSRADIEAAVDVLTERERRGMTGDGPNPRNIQTRHIVRVAPADLRAGHVTLYGVVLGTRPHLGGFFVDYPHNTTVFVDEPEPVICSVDAHFLDAVVEAHAQDEFDALSRH